MAAIGWAGVLLWARHDCEVEMKGSCAFVFAFVLLATSGISQENFTAIHQEDFARWARVTGLLPGNIHQMWRAMSHYDNEADDDSSIELVDGKMFGYREQILMITSAGLPRCLTVAVFSAPNAKVWQADQGPNARGFCDAPGHPAEINVVGNGGIEVTVWSPIHAGSSQTELHKWIYKWDEKSYMLANYLPPNDTDPKTPALRRTK